MKIDFRDDAKLNKEVYLDFRSFCTSNKNYFTEIIDKMSSPLKENLDWWVGSTASRNIIDFSLYRDFCIILFIKKLIKNNQDIEEIIVESKVVKKILRSFINDDKIKISVKKNKNRPRFLKTLIIFLYHVTYNIIKYYACRLSSHKKKTLPKLPLTFIDTYVTPRHNTSYYDSLWDLLDTNEKKTIFFLPTLAYTKIREFYSTFKKLRETSNPSFVLKEDYLKISDVLYALFYFLRIKFIKIKPIYHEDINISQLFISDFKSYEGYNNSVNGILNFRFFMRLKQAEVDLRMVVDWWENSLQDRGLHLGIYHYYKNTTALAYQAGPKNLALQLSPTPYEQTNHVVPKTIAVVGKGFVEGIKQVNQKQNVITAPAFRFYSIYNNFVHSPDQSTCTILVLLPLYQGMSLNMLEHIHSYIKKKNSSNIRILVRPHPTTEIKVLKKLFKKLSKNFEIVTGDIAKSLSKTNIVVGSASNTCLEAMGLGIPVIVIEQTFLETYGLSTIPKEIPQHFWRRCTSGDDIFDAIEYFKNQSQNNQDIGHYIREKYFEQVTRNSVTKFLKLK